MRKLYILLVLILGPLMTILAQPTMTIGDGNACTGETFCVPFTVRDFTNINSLRFSVSYDTEVLSFTNAQNFNADMANAPGNLGVGLFSEATLGEISFETWETGDCTDPGNTGVTLPDETVIFELCFEAVGAYGEQSAISVSNSPTSIRCTRNATLCNNIGLLIEDGEVTLCVRELNVTASDVTGNTGDQVCVDFVVDGFDEMKGMQFTVNYDPTILDFVSLIPNTDIPSNSGGAYGDPTENDEGAGTITVAWTYTIENPPSVDVADGTTFFTVCFDIIGPCESVSPIIFSDSPTSIQANNEDPDNPNLSQEVPLSLNVGSVTVGDCNPEGVEIIIDCGQPANINDIVCVNFLAGTNFDNVRELEYLMSWNPNILEFVSVGNPDGNLAGLSLTNDFDESNTDNGILGFEWAFSAGPAANLANADLLYEVCFRVVGVGGDSPIQILTPGVGVSNNVNIGINPTNCTVEINQPESLILDFGDVSIPFGGTDCVPVTASNFNDMLDVEFTMSWDDGIFLYTGTVQNINAALISNGPPVFTPIGTGSLAFDFSTATPLTLPDNTVLFEACFDAIGMPGECAELITVGFPFPESAITSNSNGANVGIETFSGDLCVLFPDGFGLTAENTNVGWLDTVCMNFTVESFDDITAAEFNVNWVPTALDYVSSTAIGWDVGATTFTILPPGTLQVTYSSATPTPLADDEIAFEVCFQAIGDPNECYDVGIQSDPAPTVTTTGGPGSIVITDGEICVEEQIVIRDIVIVPPSCPGGCDGEVIIIIEEWSGQGFIGTTWKTEPNQFTPLMLDNVCEGELCFTLFDNSSGVTLTDTINIVSDGVIPTAIINGDDTRTLDCNGGQVLVSAQEEDNVSYTWWMNAVGSQFCGDERTVFATSTGRKIVEVTDNMSGCVAFDTIMILAPELPVAIVNQDIAGITCDLDCVTLMGSGEGENLSYQWTILNGNPETVDSTTINTQNFTVCGPGRYRLIVTDVVTGCTNSTDDPFDEGIVEDNRIIPSVCLDPDNGGDITLEQNCDGTPHIFDASCSDNDGQDVVYEWYDVAPDGSLSNFPIEAGLTLSRSDLGTYAMLVTNLTSGCRDTAFAMIVPNVNAPIVSIEAVPAFTCATDSIVLAASYTPNDPSFTFVWELTGGSFSPGGETSLNPAALSPGSYRLIVTNPSNLCVGDSTIIIEDLTALPLAEIVDDPANQILDCTISSILLDGTPSDDDMSYQWLGPDGMPITDATADTLRVNEPGDYTLQVTNLATACSSTDVVTIDGEFETPMLTPSLLEATISCRNLIASTTVTVSNVDMFDVGEWTITGTDGSIVGTSNGGLTVEVDAAGIYNLLVTSTVSGCEAAVDFVVTADFDEPTIGVASSTLSIDCTQPTVELSGAGSETGQNIVYLWENMDTGDPVDPTALVTDTEFPGTYLFTVTDTLNGCSSDTMVMVMMDTIAPIGMIAAVDDVTCADSIRTLTVEVMAADDFLVSWIGDQLPMPTTGAEVMTTTTGLFTAVVVNTANACTDTVSITIGGDLEPPVLNLLVPEQMDCGDELIELTIDGDAADYSSIQWFDPNLGPLGGNLIQDATVLGIHTVDVISAANGCPASATVEVTVVEELELPEIVPPMAIREFDCNEDPVTIDVSETGDFMDYTILWESTTPFNVTADSFIIEALGAGTFDLTITLDGPVPGCTNTATFNVALDADTPVADAGMDVELPCGGTANLNTSGSTAMSDIFTYEWIGTGEILSGSNPLVSAEGMYQLIISNTGNGCADTSSVVTVSVLDANFNILVGDLDITCGETGNLMATADVAPSAFVTYDWVGTPELEDGTATPAVTEAGMYQLIITNVENGCTDTSAVATVNLLLPPPADAGMDQSLCGDEGDLSGNIPAAPAGITGVWTNSTGAIIDMPNAPTTMVSNLAQGGNAFTWTLSTGLCPDYSSSEVILNRAVEFTANPDILEIASDEVMGEVSLIANDVIGGAEFTISVISPPAFGSFDTTALAMGNLVYMVDILQAGMTSMTYEICSVECPEICATAMVTIDIEDRDDSFVPNTITPNDDGANDELVFDVLLFNPAEEFPDNELIVFNRWGDIIYEAKPYNNDWNGLNKEGKLVPEATYYYVLRLNIGRGQILKGDITVIR